MANLALSNYSAGMGAKPTDNAPWTEREDNIIRIASPEIAAEKLGRTLESVRARREALGLPERPSMRRKLPSRLVNR